MYGVDVPGKVLYWNYGAFVIMGLLYWTMARLVLLFIVMKMGFAWWDILIYCGCIALLSYLFYIAPLQKTQKAQEKSSGIDFMDSLIQKGKIIPQEMMLGFEDVYELKMDFDNDDSLSDRLTSQWYMHYLRIVTLRQIESNEENQIETPEELYDVVKKLEDYNKEVKKGSKNAKGKPQTREEAIEEIKQLEEEVRNVIYETTEVLPFTKFDLEASKKDKEFQEGIAFLKTQKYCYVKMYDKERFIGETGEWNELMIVLPGEYAKILKCHKDSTELDGWPVFIKMCWCFWSYWWLVTKGIPILYLNFSENMIKPQLDVLTKINAKVMAYLELKVMDLWMSDLEVRPEYIKKENVFLKAQANIYEDGFSDLIQDQADMDIKYSQFLKNKAQNILVGKIEKYKRGLIVVLCALIFFIVLMGIIISFLV